MDTPVVLKVGSKDKQGSVKRFHMILNGKTNVFIYFNSI